MVHLRMRCRHRWLTLIPFCLVGCVAYEPWPLDSAVARTEFLARSIEAPSLAKWAEDWSATATEGSATFDPRDGVSPREAEVIALLYNADLRRARAGLVVAAAGLVEAGRFEDPVLGLDAERILENVDDPWIVGGTIGLVLPLSGRLAVEKALLGREVQAEMASVMAREWETRNALRKAWIAWTADELRAAGLHEHISRVAEIAGIVERLEAAGEVPRVESRLFTLERASRTNDLLVVDQRRQRQRLELRALMGLAPTAPIEFIATLETPSRQGTAAERLALAETRNPRLLLARAAYEVAEESLNHETRKQYPDLSLSPGISSDEGIWRALLGVGFPLPIWNGNRRALAEATAKREQVRIDFAAALEQVHAELAATEQLHADAVAVLRDVEDHLVPLTDAQYAESFQAAKLGSFDALLILDSLTRLQETRERLIAARAAVADAELMRWNLQGPVRAVPALMATDAEVPVP